MNLEFQHFRTKSYGAIEKGCGSTFELCQALLSPTTTREIQLAMYLDSEFQLSRTNSSRVIENGCGSTFELHHTLLSQEKEERGLRGP